MTSLLTRAINVFQGRLVHAWLCWAVAMMANAVEGVLLQEYVTRKGVDMTRPLFDFGFHFLPYISYADLGLSVPDICSILSATLIGFGLIHQFQPSMASIVLRRILFISSCAYLGRALSVPMTLLPNPDPDCHPLLHESFPLSVVLVPFGGTITCSDVFYSGHTIPITCAILVWWDYMRYNALRWLGILVSGIALLGIIATHFHYTVDVFYGVLVTFSVWRLYHFGLCCPSVFEHFSLFRWWESDGAYAGQSQLSSTPPGVVKLDLSRDPRIIWSFGAEKPKPFVSSSLTRSQLVLLVIVGLTLSPSWLAVYHKSRL